jgi:hypothetical protein
MDLLFPLAIIIAVTGLLVVLLGTTTLVSNLLESILPEDPSDAGDQHRHHESTAAAW